jgi:hypothetical protein
MKHMGRLLIASALMTLLALGLMVWSVLQPTPLPTILAMSLGQVLGTAAFAMYVLAIIIDLRRDARARRRALLDAPLAMSGPIVPLAPSAPPATEGDPP